MEHEEEQRWGKVGGRGGATAEIIRASRESLRFHASHTSAPRRHPIWISPIQGVRLCLCLCLSLFFFSVTCRKNFSWEFLRYNEHAASTIDSTMGSAACSNRVCRVGPETLLPSSPVHYSTTGRRRFGIPSSRVTKGGAPLRATDVTRFLSFPWVTSR